MDDATQTELWVCANKTMRRQLDMIRILQEMVEDLRDRVKVLEYEAGIVSEEWDLMESPDFPPNCGIKEDNENPEPTPEA